TVDGFDTIQFYPKEDGVVSSGHTPGTPGWFHDQLTGGTSSPTDPTDVSCLRQPARRRGSRDGRESIRLLEHDRSNDVSRPWGDVRSTLRSGEWPDLRSCCPGRRDDVHP